MTFYGDGCMQRAAKGVERRRVVRVLLTTPTFWAGRTIVWLREALTLPHPFVSAAQGEEGAMLGVQGKRTRPVLVGMGWGEGT